MRIRLSDARLEDEGGYFCQLYTEDTHHQIATLTVLGNHLSLLQPVPPPFSSAFPFSCGPTQAVPNLPDTWARASWLACLTSGL